jgi:hypothetical protein
MNGPFESKIPQNMVRAAVGIKPDSVHFLAQMAGRLRPG